MSRALRYYTPPPTNKVCEARRRHIHGPIQPMEKPSLLARLWRGK